MSTEDHGKLTERSTLDVLILMLAGTVCFVIIAIVIGVFVAAIINPAFDAASAIVYLRDMSSTILAALIGLFAGRAQGRNEANKVVDPPDTTIK